MENSVSSNTKRERTSLYDEKFETDKYTYPEGVIHA
jgi:hypothetical protein